MSNDNFDKLNSIIREVYQTNENVPLHRPFLYGCEKKFLNDSINSTFVSSHQGKYIDNFTKEISDFVGSNEISLTINGTSGLHTILLASNIKKNDLVLTQPLTYVATCNAIKYTQAEPVFIDISREHLSLDPITLEDWLYSNAYVDNNKICREKKTRKKIAACVGVNTFGMPADLNNLKKVCNKWNILFIEDAAESFGSYYKGIHTGTIGDAGFFSFNGNKIITTGGGGAIVGKKSIIKKAKHLINIAKVPNTYFFHDSVGYNYRMPNLNAALGLAQIKNINKFINAKRKLAKIYFNFFDSIGIEVFKEPKNCKSNFWLNTIFLNSKKERSLFLKETNKRGILTRPSWDLMNTLPQFKNCKKSKLDVAKAVSNLILNIPSGVPKSLIK